MASPKEQVAELYSMSAKEKGAKAEVIGHALTLFSRPLSEGRVGEADHLLSLLDTHRLTARQMLAILTATLPYHDRLSHRPGFGQETYQRLKERFPGEAREMVQGLIPCRLIL